MLIHVGISWIHFCGIFQPYVSSLPFFAHISLPSELRTCMFMYTQNLAISAPVSVDISDVVTYVSAQVQQQDAMTSRVVSESHQQQQQVRGQQTPTSSYTGAGTISPHQLMSPFPDDVSQYLTTFGIILWVGCFLKVFRRTTCTRTCMSKTEGCKLRQVDHLALPR